MNICFYSNDSGSVCLGLDLFRNCFQTQMLSLLPKIYHMDKLKFLKHNENLAITKRQLDQGLDSDSSRYLLLDTARDVRKFLFQEP